MSWNHLRKMALACAAAMLALGAARPAQADCWLTDWLFGTSHTSYAPAYVAPNVCAPAAPACGCAPAPQCAPTCGCAPATTYRISYRPVPTVAYQPVTSLDPSSGCAVTTYQPTRVWTYYGSLVPSGYNANIYPGGYAANYTAGYAPYTAGYAPYTAAYAPGYYTAAYATPAYAGYAPCSTCGGGCSTCTANYGCSTCGMAAPACSSCGGGCSTCGDGGCATRGCSSCSAGVAGPSGCSSCGVGSVGGVTLPGPGEMSQPPAASTMPAPPANLGPGGSAPSGEMPRTYAPGGAPAPVAPGAPTPAPTGPTGSSFDLRSYRTPTNDASRTIDAPQIQGVPPMVNGPQLSPTPAPRPEGQDRVTSRPVVQAGYFQLLASPPVTAPAQTISAMQRDKAAPADDGGWEHYDP